MSSLDKIKVYIDFDGVILNTIDISYKMIKERNIDFTSPKVSEFYKKLDWDWLISVCTPINDSIECLKKLVGSEVFDVSVLTHVTSLKEKEVKEKYLRERIPDIDIISVDRSREKSSVTESRNAVLIDDYMGNLTVWEESGGIPIKFSTTGKKYDILAIDRLDKLFALEDEIREMIIKNKKTKAVK